MVRQGWLLFILMLLPVFCAASTPNQTPGPYTPPEEWAKRLQDPNVNVRREAVTRLENDPCPETMTWLLPMLEDPDLTVRDLTQRFFRATEQSNEQQLLAMTAEKDPVQRRRAVLALGVMQILHIGTNATSRRHLPVLYQALLDPDAGVRQAADRAFETVRRNCSYSEKMLHDFGQLRDATWRETAVYNLGWPRETELAAELLKGIASPDPATQRWSAWLLGWTNDPRAERPLIDLLKSPDPIVRLGAAEGLGRFQQARVVDPLLGALGDADPQVRAQAAQSLAWLREDAGPGVQAALAERQAAQRLVPLITDPDPFTRIAAVLSLGTFADPATARPLIAALPGGDNALRYQIVDALGKVGNPEAIPVLAETFHDKDPSLRFAAIRALANLDDPRSADLLLALLNDPDENIHRATVFEIARGRVMDARLAAPFIEVAVHGKKKDDRNFALEALGRFPGKETIQALISVLQDGDLARKAGESLIRLHDTSIVDPLLALLPDDRFPWMQTTSITVLGTLGDRKAIPVVIPYLGSKSPALRNAASRTLNQLTGQNFGEDQARWQAWWDRQKND